MADDSSDSYKKFRKPRIAQLTQAADVLQGLLQNSKSDLSDGFVRWRLEHQWAEIVGPTIGEQTVPCAFERGILYLWVKHPVWIQQLSFFQNEIRTKVNTHVGHDWAKQIKFTLSRRAASTEPKNPRD